MRECSRHLAPASEVGDKIAQRPARLRSKLVTVQEACSGDQKWLLALAGLTVALGISGGLLAMALGL